MDSERLHPGDRAWNQYLKKNSASTQQYLGNYEQDLAYALPRTSVRSRTREREVRECGVHRSSSGILGVLLRMESRNNAMERNLN